MNNSYWTRNVDFGLAPLNQLFQCMTKHIIKMKIKPHGTCFPGFREISVLRKSLTHRVLLQANGHKNPCNRYYVFNWSSAEEGTRARASIVFSHLRKLSEGKFRMASGLKSSMMMRWTIHYKSYTTTICDPLREYQQEWSGYFRALNKTNCRMMYVSIRKKRPYLKEHTHFIRRN